MADRFDEMAQELELHFNCDWMPLDPRDESGGISPQAAAIDAIAAPSSPPTPRCSRTAGSGCREKPQVKCLKPRRRPSSYAILGAPCGTKHRR